MSKNIDVNKTSRQLNAIKHPVAIVVTGFPFLLGGVLTLINPEYVLRLIMPNSGFQPFGWLVSLGFLILAGLTYLAVITFFDLVSGAPATPSMIRIIGIGFVATWAFSSVTIMVFMILLGPALLSLFKFHRIAF
jgi:hypothetical protein